MRLEVAAHLTRAQRTRLYRFETAALRTVVHGPTGSGKTTLLRIIAGLEPRARGRILFDGRSWLDDRGSAVAVHERGIGYVPQDALLFPHLSVRANLAFSPAARADDLDALARRLELTPLLDRFPRFLSGGERQLVALGRALAARPRLLLLDEAFSALHRELKERMLVNLKNLTQERGLATVLVTHQPEDAVALAAESHPWEPAREAACGAVGVPVPDLQQRGLPDSEHLPISGLPELNSR